MAKVWLHAHDCDTGNFPDVCLQCGAPATTRVGKFFRSMSPWVYLTPLVPVLAFLLVAGLMRRPKLAAVPMCRDHRYHWTIQFVAIWGSLMLLGAGLGALVVVEEVWRWRSKDLLEITPPLGILLGFSILMWSILAIALTRVGIRATKITAEGMELVGVCEEFIRVYTGSGWRRVEAIDPAAAERWNEQIAARRKRESAEHIQREDSSPNRGHFQEKD